MIQNKIEYTPQENWAKELSKGLVTVAQLALYDIIDDKQKDNLSEIKNNFDIRVPQSFLKEIQNNHEPLKKQFVPSENELKFSPEELEDPIGDEKWTPVEGITHRYPDRVLLKPTYMCAAYCRFCFRRYKVSHSEFNLKEAAYEKALEYLNHHIEIDEVILTGGDPLTLSDKVLNKICLDISKINHIKTLRIHTRVPSLLPTRITLNLIQILKASNKVIWVASHMNHVDEFNLNTKKALALFADNGIPLLLQSVLLKGVNDTSQDLIQLFKTAIENRVKPYYLHYPDLAKGTKHFRIPLHEAILLVKSLRGKISGLCLPQFILDIPGGKGKIEINPHSYKEISPGLWQFESPLDGTLVEIQYN